MNLTEQQRAAIVQRQRFEITEYTVYTKLAERVSNPTMKEQLFRIAESEKRHYDILKGFSGTDVLPKKGMVRLYVAMTRCFGLHFTLHFMERGEEAAQMSYQELVSIDPIFAQIQKEEEEHEHELISMIDSNVMKYVGSFVLGLNDAIVEVTGTVAGLTIALSNTRLIGAVTLIGGISAAMSMAGSEYLSTKEEGGESPKRAAFVTGSAYFITIGALLWPFFVFSYHFTALAATLCSSIVVIALFNFYVSIAKNLKFTTRFLEMTLISLGVAAISFVIGEGISRLLGITV
jgi:VIT1/CCC1 family predicted Fe2+/Mn2+ transporter